MWDSEYDESESQECPECEAPMHFVDVITKRGTSERVCEIWHCEEDGFYNDLNGGWESGDPFGFY